MIQNQLASHGSLGLKMASSVERRAVEAFQMISPKVAMYDLRYSIHQALAAHSRLTRLSDPGEVIAANNGVVLEARQQRVKSEAILVI